MQPLNLDEHTDRSSRRLMHDCIVAEKYEFCGKGDEYIAEKDIGDAVGLFYNFCDDS